jgi:hydroxyacylglutathione hydrolase
MPEIAGAGRRKVARAPGAATIEPVADRVWLVRGGGPPKRTMNVYLIEDDGGVTLFDAGIHQMTRWIRQAVDQMGGLKRIVLGHGHQDHRGAAPELDAPVYCHPDEVADAEGDAGEHYFDYSKLKPLPRFYMPRFLKMWDGGPVKVEGTLSEGDAVAGFRVVHVPGHAPGQIALFRDSDRLALTTDTFYTLDPESVTARYGAPCLPHSAFNWDTERARESIRKLAALEPASAWPGHANPLTGDVRAQLEHAAATT